MQANSCDLVTFPTAYSLYNRSDYKRCVCDSWFMDAEGCILGKKSDVPELQTTTTDDKNPDQASQPQPEKPVD